MTTTEPPPLPYLRLSCGFDVCEKLGEVSRLDGARSGLSQSVVWGMMLPGDFAEDPRGSGIWRHCRVRRPRTTMHMTRAIRPYRTREGALYVTWAGAEADGGPVPMWNHRELHGPDWRSAQAIGPIGVVTPPELVIICRNGHHSHLTVAHIEQEAERLRQSLHYA